MLMCDLFLILQKIAYLMLWKFCKIKKSSGKWGPEGTKFCEILSHSVRYGMYVSDINF